MKVESFRVDPKGNQNTKKVSILFESKVEILFTSPVTLLDMPGGRILLLTETFCV